MARQTKAPLSTPTEVVLTGGVSEALKTLDQKTGKAPRTRVKDAKALHRTFVTLMEADRKSQFNRKILEEMADGAPPQNEGVLAAQGMQWVYNLNFLEADTHMASALASYDDLCDSTEHLIVPEAKPNVLDPDDLTEALDIVAEEHAKLVRESSEFYTNWNALATEFVGHGVGWAYFPDAETPWWEPVGWDNFLIPRKTKAIESKVTEAITRHGYPVNELYNYIEDPKYAAKWNVNEVRKAIVMASKGAQYANRWKRYWPEIELELKNNDIGFGLGDAEEVQALHYWVREFDGSYSFYIGLENGTNQDYLYCDENRYSEATEAFVSFTLGVGKKRTYHSIRGALWKMFPFVQTSNRFRNKMLTNTDIAMTLLLQGDEGDSYDDMQITLGPAIGYLPPGAKVVEREMPDVGTQGLPIIRDLSLSLQNATGQFQSPAPTTYPTDQKGNPPTKYQLQSQQSSDGALTSNSVARFYRSQDKLSGQQFKRIQKIGPTGKELGNGKCKYPEVKEFYERCKERLAPLGIKAADFIQKGIRRVTAARAIGNGSPQLRLLALDELNQMAGALDETGRALAIRDRIALKFGRVIADRYKPRQVRIAPDAQIAMLENAALASDSFPPLPDQNHAVHASIHVPKFQQIVETLVSYREQDPEADFKPMEPKLQQASNIHDHAALHVQEMANDPLRANEMKDYRAALEQGANLLQGFAHELQQQERHQIDNGPSGAPAAGASRAPGGDQAKFDAISASDPRYTLEIQRQQEELQQKRDLHQKALELASAKVAQVAQQMKIAGIKADAEIAGAIKARQNSVPSQI